VPASQEWFSLIGDLDVDQEDFGRLQGCLCGSFNLPAAGCEETDLEDDVDVDSSDVAVFVRCMTGAGVSGDRFGAE